MYGSRQKYTHRVGLYYLGVFIPPMAEFNIQEVTEVKQ
jgi:hypothetical protein